MRNFDVIYARCFPCFQYALFEAIHQSEKLNNTSILLSDYVSTRSPFLFLIETFECAGTVLFTCFSHLIKVFDFEYRNCYRYMKKSYFSAVFNENTIMVRNCYDCYRKTVEKL